MTDVGTGVAIALATGAFTYLFSVVSDIRKRKLDFVNTQIEKLYGPLYALTQASNATWSQFKEQPYWREDATPYFFDDTDPPTVDEAKRWRAWMKAVFQALNIEMEKVIVDNSQLIIGNNMPRVFNELIAHTEAYKAVIYQWRDSDFDGCSGNTITACPQLSSKYNTAPYNYPIKIIVCVDNDYRTLKMRQELLNKSLFAALFDSPTERSRECE
jgi:hypothetical protein